MARPWIASAEPSAPSLVRGDRLIEDTGLSSNSTLARMAAPSVQTPPGRGPLGYQRETRIHGPDRRRCGGGLYLFRFPSPHPASERTQRNYKSPPRIES